MKAIVQEGYGSPDTLKLREIETPAAGDNGVLVEVHAASVNALDWHVARGVPFFIPILEAISAPKHRVRGVDLAGRVTAVGKNVTRFKPGDEVLGGADGSFAEFTVTTEKRLAPKPAGITFEQAATLNVAGLTALQGLRDRARVRAGQRVLVNGAGGGVGTFAVPDCELARRARHRRDARRERRPRPLPWRRRGHRSRRRRLHQPPRPMGRHLRHWRHPSVQSLPPRPESGRNPRRHRRAGGTMARAGGSIAPGRDPVAAHSAPRVVPFVAKSDPEDLAILAGLVERGTITPVIDRRFALSETAEAVRRLGAGPCGVRS